MYGVHATIYRVGREIGMRFKLSKVILFGSYAEGRATPDSDVDLLVVTPFKGSSIDKSVEIHMQVRPPFSVDLLVRTPQAIDKRLCMGDQFIRSIF